MGFHVVQTEVSEEDNESRRKLQAPSIDIPIWISCSRQDGQEETSDLEAREIYTRDIGDRAGFTSLKDVQYRHFKAGSCIVSEILQTFLHNH